MDIKCRCGKTCINPAPEILKNIDLLYSSCARCDTVQLKKFSPLARQVYLNEIDNDFKSCRCGKRHLDAVIAHVLKIMIDEGVKDEKSSLRNACTPLITPAYPLNSAPYLPENSLVILSNDLNKNCAKRIVNEVSQVKGVLKGDLRETVGIKDVNFNPNVYELLSGCDIRCDIVQTPYGALCIHKHQGKTHIEFPKVKSPKIEILRKVLDKYDAPSVLDCTCGPGTLGIACLKAGARFVVFNDLWFPAVTMTAINLEANGFPVDSWDSKKEIIAEGENFKIYSLDIRELEKVLDEKFDICIVDAFPGVDTTEFVEAAGKLGKEVVVI
ncbi:MAG: 50S ribosomal protein L11 methyltransferase [Methanobacterium sp.]|uniref:50S ribosomal protein L11 methyltransferase n=1 Tax=Methanobacterium sp. TaxID=2164 RepID=UPI003D65347B|nr:50S ribosomal protein L11 methyltransferase [Methanobacterium sp.]